ncbi:MAG: c-type cytochrome [Ilumatobacteraceae bacterium]|nr:c-type cytochrome [Ilumatobacteraceae bacterium]
MKLHTRRWLHLVPIAAAAAVGFVTLTSSASEGASPYSAQSTNDLGADLFAKQCSSCHGLDGLGVEDRGPTLEHEGRAAADFVLRTGRMPLAAPNIQAKSGPVRFTEEEIVALVDHVGSLGAGPDIPNVDITNADIGDGGAVFRLNCAACHVASGAGTAIGGSHRAPSLAKATPTEVGEAILVGPGAMPVFSSLTDDDINNVAAYIKNLQEQGTTDALHFGGAGPAAEGLAAWLLALIPLIAITRWIGRPNPGRDHPVATTPSGTVSNDSEPDPDDH